MTHRTVMSSLAAACILVATVAQADTKKVLRFWNLTATTITELYVAAEGTGKWSGNLCLNDKDHTVEPDERLSLDGIGPGKYDLRVIDQDKRKCLFPSTELRTQGAYALALSEEQMKTCHGW